MKVKAFHISTVTQHDSISLKRRASKMQCQRPKWINTFLFHVLFFHLFQYQSSLFYVFFNVSAKCHIICHKLQTFFWLHLTSHVNRGVGFNFMPLPLNVIRYRRRKTSGKKKGSSISCYASYIFSGLIIMVLEWSIHLR